MVGTTPEQLERDIDALVQDQKVKRRALGELTVVFELTARERDRFWRYVGGLEVEIVGERYF